MLSYQTQDKILEKSWLFLNETDKVKVIENIEALEGDIWTTDEVLRLATKKLPLGQAKQMIFLPIVSWLF